MTDFNSEVRYKRINALQAKNATTILDPYYHRHDRHINAVATVGLIGIGVVVGMVLITGIKACDRDYKDPPKELNCHQCHSRQTQLTEYFKMVKTPNNPELMAQAVLQTRSPRLLAAIHVAGEKKSTATSMKGGYKGRHFGAWQTSRAWGKPTYSIAEQALIAELALETHLTEEKKIVPALNAYGGQSDKNRLKNSYAQAVLDELQRVP